jgi:hypothetical protein
MKSIFKLLVVTGLLASALSVTGCAYGVATTVGKDYVVVTKNDTFLFGAFRKVYVCKATASGLSGCKDNESP